MKVAAAAAKKKEEDVKRRIESMYREEKAEAKSAQAEERENILNSMTTMMKE